MASRLRKERDNDLSAVGTIGRRTGITLPRARIDDNGMEEITGIFSSPHKASPGKPSVRGADVRRAKSIPSTPAQTLSAGRAPRLSSLARSASPKKTGINGSARRSQVVDLESATKHWQVSDPEDQENRASHSIPLVPPGVNTRRESPPLQDITFTGNSHRFSRSRNRTSRSPQVPIPEVQSNILNNFEDDWEHVGIKHDTTNTIDDEVGDMATDLGFSQDAISESGVGVIDPSTAKPADNESHVLKNTPLTPCEASLDDEEIEQILQNTPHLTVGVKEPAKVNSVKKRKLDALSPISGSTVQTFAAKKQTREVGVSDTNTEADYNKQHPVGTSASMTQPMISKKHMVNGIDRMTAQQEAELDHIVERIKQRPGPPKSLYVLRRETPADQSTTHTRSGRVSIKPLAYWRNERCIYGTSPSSSHFQQGTRFPLNSIREIVRSEELGSDDSSKVTKRKKKHTKTRGRSHGWDSEGDNSIHEDADAEEWESAVGIFRGQVAIWDPQQEAPLEEEEDYDIAYAPASLQTREVPGSSFRYAKLLSMPFFGSGIVELPPGGVKRPKNSRKMHMAFFVAKGRVTVQVGPMGDNRQSRFSVGQRGFWQVPRGNQYSIENEADRPARIFFSQGCEVAPESMG